MEKDCVTALLEGQKWKVSLMLDMSLLMLLCGVSWSEAFGFSIVTWRHRLAFCVSLNFCCVENRLNKGLVNNYPLQETSAPGDLDNSRSYRNDLWQHFDCSFGFYLVASTCSKCGDKHYSVIALTACQFFHCSDRDSGHLRGQRTCLVLTFKGVSASG